MAETLAEALGRIRGRAEKATKGPWYAGYRGVEPDLHWHVLDGPYMDSETILPMTQENVIFTAAARSDVPALIEACEILAKAAEGVLDGAALEFSDPRVSYETWQMNPGAIEELRAALSAAAQALKGRE